MPATGSPDGPPTRLAVIGAGRFGAFVMDAAKGTPEVECRVVTDQDEASAARLAAAHGCRAVGASGVDELMGSGEVDALVIATPPVTHADLARRALDAGLEVFCEKPIAVRVEDAEDLVAAAERLGRVVVVDHVLRYNPLVLAVRRMQREMGWAVTRFLFENDAADESLPADHWFWDQGTSGGIFVEHGVHFFDAAALFIGTPATSVTAVTTRRPGWRGADLATASVVHGAALATHTHSFTHAHRAERQLMRIDFGFAEAQLHGWIPVDAEIVAFTGPSGAKRLHALAADPALVTLPSLPTVTVDPTVPSRVTVTDEPVDGPATASGRGVEAEASHRVTVRLSLGGERAKAAVYRTSVRAALADLHACRVQAGRRPRSGARTATDALRVAVHASEAAWFGRTRRIHPPGSMP